MIRGYQSSQKGHQVAKIYFFGGGGTFGHFYENGYLLIQLSRKMSYSRVPEAFMRDKFMSPHTFNDPENPSHGEFVNLQLRNDLYYSTLQEISNVQFRWANLFSKEEWVKVQSIKDCSNESARWFHQLSGEYKRARGKTLKESQNVKVELLTCEEWQVAYHHGHNVHSSKYRVHILQTNTDIFKSQIFPPTLFKAAKDLLIN